MKNFPISFGGSWYSRQVFVHESVTRNLFSVEILSSVIMPRILSKSFEDIFYLADVEKTTKPTVKCDRDL